MAYVTLLLVYAFLSGSCFASAGSLTEFVTLIQASGQGSVLISGCKDLPQLHGSIQRPVVLADFTMMNMEQAVLFTRLRYQMPDSFIWDAQALGTANASLMGKVFDSLNLDRVFAIQALDPNEFPLTEARPPYHTLAVNNESSNGKLDFQVKCGTTGQRARIFTKKRVDTEGLCLNTFLEQDMTLNMSAFVLHPYVFKNEGYEGKYN